MANSKKPTTPDAFDVIAGLQNLFGALPSEQQRGEAVEAFDKLINFLTEVREKFTALPTQEQAAELSPSLAKLEHLFRYAEKRAIDDSAANDAKPEKPVSRAAAKDNEADVSALAEAIKRLPAEAIKAQLEGKQHSAQTLKALAIALGTKPGSRETKASLVNRIVNHIENIRMSDRLAGRTGSEWSVVEQQEAPAAEAATVHF